MNQIVHVSYLSQEAASRAVGALLDNGVNSHDISVYMKNAPNGYDAEESTREQDVEQRAEHGLTVTTPADAGEGAMKGAGIGLGIGVLAALASIAIPGVGLVLGGGALAAAAGGAAATAAAGAVAGGAYGYLMDQGVNETEARIMSDHLEAGRVVVSVLAPSKEVSADRILAILSKYNEDQYAAVRQEVEDDDWTDESVPYTHPATQP